MSLLAALAAIAVLAVLVFVHELGHFLAARWQGIYANRFSLGFGPILWKYQGPETEYAIRAIPLGGFVGFPDDDPDSGIPENDPNLLRNRPIADRTIVISAGVIANLIFAYLLLVAQVGWVGTQELNFQPGVIVAQVSQDAGSAATKAGMKAGDIVLAAGGQELGASQNSMPALMQAIQSRPNQPLDLTVQRGDRSVTLTVTPIPAADGKGRIGVQLAPNGKVVRRKAGNIIEVFAIAARDYQRMTVSIVQGFGQLVSNFKETADKVSGPVAIVAIGANIARDDITNLLQFAALISINLAIINILPLPALDGGQLAFLLIEALRGKPVPTHIQDGVMQTGLMLLLGLGVFLIVKDTASLPWVQKLLQ